MAGPLYIRDPTLTPVPSPALSLFGHYGNPRATATHRSAHSNISQNLQIGQLVCPENSNGQAKHVRYHLPGIVQPTSGIQYRTGKFLFFSTLEIPSLLFLVTLDPRTLQPLKIRSLDELTPYCQCNGSNIWYLVVLSGENKTIYFGNFTLTLSFLWKGGVSIYLLVLRKQYLTLPAIVACNLQ